jgi:hypothetical protein
MWSPSVRRAGLLLLLVKRNVWHSVLIQHCEGLMQELKMARTTATTMALGYDFRVAQSLYTYTLSTKDRLTNLRQFRSDNITRKLWRFSFDFVVRMLHETLSMSQKEVIHAQKVEHSQGSSGDRAANPADTFIVDLPTAGQNLVAAIRAGGLNNTRSTIEGNRNSTCNISALKGEVEHVT